MVAGAGFGVRKGSGSNYVERAGSNKLQDVRVGEMDNATNKCRCTCTSV